MESSAIALRETDGDRDKRVSGKDTEDIEGSDGSADDDSGGPGGGDRKAKGPTKILHKSSKEFYKAMAKQWGITCKMSDHCRCLDCQVSWSSWSRSIGRSARFAIDGEEGPRKANFAEAKRRRSLSLSPASIGERKCSILEHLFPISFVLFTPFIFHSLVLPLSPVLFHLSGRVDRLR